MSSATKQTLETIRSELARAMLCDRHRLGRRLRRSEGGEALDGLLAEVRASVARADARRARNNFV